MLIICLACSHAEKTSWPGALLQVPTWACALKRIEMRLRLLLVCLSALSGTAWHCLAPSGTVLHGRVHSWDTCNLPVAAVDDAPKPSQPLKIMPAAPFCALFLSAFLPYRQAYCVVSALMGLLALGISDEDHRGTTESDQCKLNPRREFAGSTRVRWRYL